MTTDPDLTAAVGPPPEESQYARRWAWVRPTVLRSLVGALIAAAVVGAVSALVGHFGILAGQVLSSIAMVAVVSLLIGYDAEVSARRSDAFGIVSLVVSGYLVLAGLVEIWLPRGPAPGGDDWHGFGSWLLLVAIARVALLHVHLLLNVYRRFPTPGMRGLARVTFALVGVLGAMLSLIVFTGGDVDEWYWRIVAAVTILDVTGTVLIPLIHALFFRERMTSARTAAPRPQTAQGAPVPATEPLGVPAPAGPPGAAGAPWEQQAAAPWPEPILPSPATQQPHDPAAYAYVPQSSTPLRLAWPRYEDGRPLPQKPDGTPDFSGVLLS